MAQNRVQAIPIISFASADLTTSFQALNGPAGLPAACFAIHVTNTTSTTVSISFDGINTADVIVTDTRIDLPFQTNAQPTAWTALLPAGQIIYAKATAGTGTLYISGYYVTQT